MDFLNCSEYTVKYYRYLATVARRTAFQRSHWPFQTGLVFLSPLRMAPGAYWSSWEQKGDNPLTQRRAGSPIASHVSLLFVSLGSPSDFVLLPSFLLSHVVGLTAPVMGTDSQGCLHRKGICCGLSCLANSAGVLHPLEQEGEIPLVFYIPYSRREK